VASGGAGYLEDVIHLASQSPQRAMLLAKAGVAFVVVPTTADEDAISASAPTALALERARAKALAAVLPDAQGEVVVLGADTVVALGRDLFGKPHDRADAVRILGRLSGTTHQVITGHHLVLRVGGQITAEASGVAVAKVTMRAMSAAEIAAYVDSGESDHRAGAYAIQETGDRFVVDVQGNFETVVGLQVATVARLYRELTDRALPLQAAP